MSPRRPLLDHHVHGVVDHDLDRTQSELLLNEGGRPAPAGTSHFDSPVGLAVLSRCGPLLGLDPDCGPEQYVEARTTTGVAGDCSRSRAEGVRRLVERDNARRLYHLDTDGVAA